MRRLLLILLSGCNYQISPHSGYNVTSVCRSGEELNCYHGLDSVCTRGEYEVLGREEYQAQRLGLLKLVGRCK